MSAAGCRPPRRLAGWIGALLVVVAAIGPAGCSFGPRDNFELEQAYGRSAREHGPYQNPVVMIPGLSGSRLVHRQSGQTVWGAFTGDYARPESPSGARLISMPMAVGSSLGELHDGVTPDGVLEELKVRLLGLPLSLKAYFYILGALGAGGYRDEELGLSGAVDWGEDHFTCFQFDFDWRRDNAENAARLAAFLEEKREYVRTETLRRWGVDREEIRFDVVSHSMGGLLLRYYLRHGGAPLGDDGELPPLTWAGAELVESAILVAPPNAGTLESLLQLTEGRDYGPSLPKYPAPLLGTFPSGYQMLPRARHGGVVWADDGEPVGDLFDPVLWEQLGWGLASSEASELLSWLLPEELGTEARRAIALDHLRKSLIRARRFTEALDRPAEPPPTLRLHLVAGDAIPTKSRIEVDRESGALMVVARAPGDGKVLRSSALMDERLAGEWTSRLRSPIGWHEVLLLFRDHLALTKDPTFTNNLLFWLLEAPRRSGGSAAALGASGARWQDRRSLRRAAAWRVESNEEKAS
jgi:hypothetical protein